MTTASLEIPPDVVEAIAQRAADIVREREPVQDQWLDAKSAAEYLAIPISSLHKLSAARLIPCSQDVPGGKLYFKRSELDAWRSTS